jgi:histidine ammonia-lyase
MAAVILDGTSLTIDALWRIADGADVTIADEARKAMAKGRAIVEQHLKDGIPVYGLNTGLGSKAGQALPPEALANFSAQIVRGRAHSVGPLLSAHEVRAVMAVRLNTMLTGASGASPGLADRLMALLNGHVTPSVPRIGSIGASDLVVMATLSLAVMDGFSLAPKDGLVLSSNTAFSAGLAAMAAHEARRALDTLQVSGALTLTGFRGNRAPFAPEALSLRNDQHIIAAGRQIFALTEGLGPARRLQDPLSLRCMALIHGAAYGELARLDEAVTVEINTASDNPAVILAREAITGTANFQMPHLTLALDGMARALAMAANEIISRFARLMNEAASGLPPLLAAREAGSVGFGPLIKPAEALRAEIIHLATPVPILSSQTADGQEDSATFAALSAHKLKELIDRLDLLAAFELAAAAQAVDLAQATLPPRLKPVHAAIRELSATMDEDRPMGREIEAIAEKLVTSGEAVRLAGPQV